MDLSMRWLSDYVKLEQTPKQFSDAMTMSGSKVEGWRVEGCEIDKVLVGKILSIEPHPHADSLVICQVDVGAKEPLQIVTGAKNLAAGDLVPVAVDGASLPGGHQIVTSALRGEKSEGMLCSLGELGLSVHDFPYAIEDGIFVIKEPCFLGERIQDALGLNDTVVEFEITPNRPDCLSVTGLAREAAATFGAKFELSSPVMKSGVGSIHELLSVDLRSDVLCPRYVAMAVTNVKIGPSPRWMRERLRASGVRPINNIVDITNYVMLEYGQPMHAFDISCVSGGTLVIRNAAPGETIVTLDGITRTLSPDMLVIADAEKPSAVAGVMGGEGSGIHSDTNTVVFESANFQGSAIRVTARKLGMRTEASSRYEKGLDPDVCATAAKRACELVELLGAGEVVSGMIDVNHARKALTEIPLDVDWINRFLGIEVSRDAMIATLLSLEFKMNGDKVVVPSFRADVKHKADLAEEVARYYGYNNIPSTSIQGACYGSVTAKQKLERLAIGTLLSEGMNEVCTYTFISPKAFDKVRIPADSPLRRTVTILNPLGEDTSVMRTCVYPSMMEVLARNYNNRNASASLFELGREYIPAETPDQLPEEKQVLALGMYGEQFDYYSIKGAVDALLDAFGIRDIDVEAVTDHPTFHPGRCAAVSKNGTPIALLGEVHPAVCQNYALGARAYLARIDFSVLGALTDAGRRAYRPLPRFPASTRDMALLCSDTLPVLTIEKAVRSAVGEILESVELFDHYKGAQIPQGKKSLAFALVMRAADRTLTDAEVGAAMERALSSVTALGAELRA